MLTGESMPAEIRHDDRGIDATVIVDGRNERANPDQAVRDAAIDAAHGHDPAQQDQTGSITTGVLRLFDVVTADGEQPDELLRLRVHSRMPQSAPSGKRSPRGLADKVGELPAVEGPTPRRDSI